MSSAKNPDLLQDSICICLFSRGDGKFHWAIIIPVGYKQAQKFHITNLHGPSWVFESVSEMVSASETACIVAKIGSLGIHTVEDINNRVKNIPLISTAADSAEPFTCRIWVRYAVRALHDTGYINCPNVLALENEIRVVGESNDAETIQGKGYKLYTASNST
ncbi:hypothetical protein BJ138DRAFT_1063969 [Hygrophoropsis aurantiaca]|uniref:Uncharacterized protein n=1 Tax=Hygrophoropsis aurantiaca TaxID=72124 RepID=A0ACB8ABU7_9AGAM|nr:hypothetical protein BJ138DRAFT_1063969 [Hygrophoropsis aurantiaca]